MIWQNPSCSDLSLRWASGTIFYFKFSIRRLRLLPMSVYIRALLESGMSSVQLQHWHYGNRQKPSDPSFIGAKTNNLANSDCTDSIPSMFHIFGILSAFRFRGVGPVWYGCLNDRFESSFSSIRFSVPLIDPKSSLMLQSFSSCVFSSVQYASNIFCVNFTSKMYVLLFLRVLHYVAVTLDERVQTSLWVLVQLVL